MLTVRTGPGTRPGTGSAGGPSSLLWFFSSSNTFPAGGELAPKPVGGGGLCTRYNWCLDDQPADSAEDALHAGRLATDTIHSTATKKWRLCRTAKEQTVLILLVIINQSATIMPWRSSPLFRARERGFRQ